MGGTPSVVGENEAKVGSVCILSGLSRCNLDFAVVDSVAEVTMASKQS